MTRRTRNAHRWISAVTLLAACGPGGAGSDPADDGSLDAGAPAGPPSVTRQPISALDVELPSGRECVMATAVECGGPADCGDGEVCCGRYDFYRLAYERIRCSESCNTNEGDIEICQGGDACGTAGFVCRSSFALPEPLLVCAPPSELRPPAEAMAPTLLRCGERACEQGETCCLRMLFDHEQQAESWEPMRCVSSDAGCRCGAADGAGAMGGES